MHAHFCLVISHVKVTSHCACLYACVELETQLSIT